MDSKDLPTFKSGEEVSAGKLNKLAGAISQSLLPGGFNLPGMNLQRPIPSNAGGFQLVRGQTLTSVAPSDVYFEITNLVEFEENAELPEAPLMIKAPSGGVTLGAGAYVWAAYHSEIGTTGSETVDWAMIPTGGGGSEAYRLVRGRVTATVTADDTSFNIDNIIRLASGNDPRADAEDSDETLTITNSQKEQFETGEIVTGIYYNSGFGEGWQTLYVERYRAIRGTWYSGTTNLSIKNVVPLDCGVDPRSNPTNADEQVTVFNLHEEDYTTGDKVTADYNVTGGDGVGRWEARPKKSKGGVPLTCSIGSPISAGSAASPASGSATIYDVDGSGGTTSRGSKTIYNPFHHAVKGSGSCLEIGSTDSYLLMGIDILEVLALRDGFGAKKTLAVGEGGSGPTDIEWLGAECEE